MSDQMDKSSGGHPAGQAHEGFTTMQQLTIYFQETDHWGHRPLYLRILELVRTANGAGATVLRGVAGYSASSRSIHTAGFADLQPRLPLVVIVVDTEERVNALIPQLEELIRPNGGLITVQDLEGHSYLHPHKPRGGAGNA
jgi:PII-like signaling protein